MNTTEISEIISIMYNFDNNDIIPEFGEEVRDTIDNGDIVGLRQALDKGAGINMHFGRYKTTPIHFASKKQNLEIVEELIKRGADINGTDRINDRPLHEAVRFGSQSILSFLLKNSADPNVQNDYEDTPLLYCFDTSRFRINGWTKKAQVLLKHGARTDLQNMHSQMAVDHLYKFLQVVRNGKNIEKEIRNSEELAEAYHLYDVLTEVPGSGEHLLLGVIQSLTDIQEQPPTCHGQDFKEMCESALSVLSNRDWNLPWENLDDVPSEIHQLGTVTEDMFLSSLQKKHAQPKYIRLMIVGDVGVGKTSLCLNLIKEDKEAIPTDGINVFIQNYLVDMKTGKWEKLSNEDIQNLPTKLLSTVCRDKETHRNKSLSETTIIEEEQEDEEEKRKEEGRKKSETLYLRVSDESQTEEGPSHPPKRKRNDSEKLKTTLQGVNATDIMRDDDALLSIWDFAGDEIYEATHHIFMSPDAVYIIMFNADACLKDKSNLDKLYTWQEVIKTYSTKSLGKGTSIKMPPIILVGSHLDKMGCSNEEKEASKIKLFNTMERLSASSISCLHFVDNTNKNDPAIQQIKDAIVTLAPSQENWNKRIPATWVTLDIDLRMLKQQKRYIIRFSEVIEIDKRNEVSIGDSEELKHCLRYMHLTGNILFFENEREDKVEQEPIVLTHPQWIVDAFKCIIKAMRFIRCKDEKTKLEIIQFQRSGMLTLGLLESLLGNYRGHQDILIEIMQRLHLLVAVTEETAERTWIVPSLLPPRDAAIFDDVLSHPNAAVSKTFCFVFKSKLLSAIYDKLLATCLSSVLEIKKDSEGKSLMKRGCACFMINRACDLLMSCTGAVVSCTLINKNGKKEFTRKRSFVRSLLSDGLKDIFNRFHHGNLSYKPSLHCRHEICSDSCPVPIKDISMEGQVCCCNSSDNLHSLNKSEAESWMEEKEGNEDSEYKLPDVILDSSPTEQMLLLLSLSYIGRQYELFFTRLELESATISSHQSPNSDIPTVIYNLFLTWKKRKGKQATIRNILRGMEFMDLDYVGAADKLDQEYRKWSSNST